MADIKGSAAKLAASSDGVSYTDVGGVKDISLSHSAGTIDVNDFDQATWDQHLVDRMNAVLNATMNYDEADAGQDLIRTAATTGAQYYFRYRPAGDGSGSKDEIILQGTITSMEDTSADGSPAEMSVSVQSTGAVTYQQQP